MSIIEFKMSFWLKDPEMGDTPGLNEPPPAYQPNFGANNYGATGENDNMSPSDIPPPYDQSQQPAGKSELI